MNRVVSCRWLTIFPVVAALVTAFAATGCRGRAQEASADDPPIACRLGVLSPAERARQQELRKAISQNVLGMDEMPDGYRLRYPDDASMLGQLAEWIPLERRCCPFLSFDIEWPAGAGGPALRLSGRKGVKEFLAAEMK